MQVKKFEAKSMKEALQLVKQELGPEAIILNAKDNKKFGLLGRGSVEVTAAISEKAIERRRFAERHLPETKRGDFKGKSAKHQKTFIDKTINRYQQRQEATLQTVLTRPPTQARYIDIHDEAEPEVQGRRVDDVLEDFLRTGQYALEDGANKAQPQFVVPGKVAPAPSFDVSALKQEVDSLRALLNQKNPVTRHPGAEFGISFELSLSFERLQNAGLDTRYIVEILEKADKELSPLEKKKKALVDGWVARYILGNINVTGDWKADLAGERLHLFVGPGGHGKTTSLVKIASQLALKEKKKVAIFTADTLKVGTADQLRIYSQILGLPFETVKHSVEFSKLMARYNDVDVFLVDYPSFTLKDISEIDQLKSLLPLKDVPHRTHLVMSCATKDIDAYEICQRYQAAQFNDFIVTKVDDSHGHGLLFNLQRKADRPLYAFGIGSKIPEDVELATRERVLDLIYKITKKGF